MVMEGKLMSSPYLQKKLLQRRWKYIKVGKRRISKQKLSTLHYDTRLHKYLLAETKLLSRAAQSSLEAASLRVALKPIILLKVDRGIGRTWRLDDLFASVFNSFFGKIQCGSSADSGAELLDEKFSVFSSSITSPSFDKTEDSSLADSL